MGINGGGGGTMTALASAAHHRQRTAALVNLAMVVEQANEQLLPAVYLFVGSSLRATPSQLGTLTLCRALVQTLASPLSGVLGDRCDRRLVLAAGAFIWGAMTSAIALSGSLRAAMVFAAANGLGLALLVPCCQSLVADLHAPESRGRAFGLMQLTGAVGGMAGSVFATNMGASRALAAAGFEGWRVAFHCVALASVATGALVLAFAVDPRRSALPSLLARAASYDALPSRDPSPPPGAHAASGGKAAAAALAAAAAPPPSAHHPEGARGHGAGGSGGGAPDAAATTTAARLHYSASPARARPAAAMAAGSGNVVPADDQAPHDASHHHYHQHHHHQQQQQHHQHQQQHDAHHHHHALSLGPWVGEPAASADSVSDDANSDGGGSGSGAASKHRTRRRHLRRHQQRRHGRGGALPLSSAPSPSPPPRPRRGGLLADVGWVLRIPTFQAIVLQGVVGCFPWQAAVFFTLWLQLQGFGSATAAAIAATFGAGVAGGALLGGFIGDRMARRLPDSGRILTAQASVAAGIPLVWLLLKGVPASPLLASDARAYAAVLFVLGLTCTWAGAGCNSPIFAEVCVVKGAGGSVGGGCAEARKRVLREMGRTRHTSNKHTHTHTLKTPNNNNDNGVAP